MKKVKMLYTIGVLSLLLSVNLTISCADITGSSNDAHTICYEYTNPNGSAENQQSVTTTTTTTINNYIAYDVSADSYYGEFVGLYSSYEKSSLSVECEINGDESFDKVDLYCSCYGDQSGDMIRFIVEFLCDQTVVSGKTFSGVHIDKPYKELEYTLPFDNSADTVRVTVQARYYSAKGGSKTDIIRFDNLAVRFNNNPVLIEECSDLSADEHDCNTIASGQESHSVCDADKETAEQADTQADCVTDQTDDNTSDKTVDSIPNEESNSELEEPAEKTDVSTDARIITAEDNSTDTADTFQNLTRQINYDADNGCYFGEMTELRTDYGKASVCTEFIQTDHTGDIWLECEICCDGSGDYVRFIVEYFDETDTLIETETLTGKLYQRNVITSYRKQLSKPDRECLCVRLTVQAKYESKKGGSRTDVVKFNKLRI